MALTNRQQLLLKYIIEEYNKSAIPISSKHISEKFLLDISPQTIRIDMAVLEKENLITKPHSSAGRVPSILGYEYYDTYLLESNLPNEVRKKLTDIFNKRERDINNIISETLNILNEITGLVSLSSTFNITEESLRQINLIQLDDSRAVILIVSNLANINKTFVNFTNESQLKDLQICMKIFNQHLIGVNFSDINKKLIELEDIIKKQVLEYEYVTREILFRLFSFVDKTKSTSKKVVGLGSILTSPDFTDKNQLKKIVDMIEKGTIWDIINFNLEKDTHSKVILHHDDDLPICVSSTIININNQQHQISVVGSNRINNAEIKGILEYLNQKLEEIFNFDENK